MRNTVDRSMRLALALFILAAHLLNLIPAPAAVAAPIDGDLRIEAIYAPNFVVDSNVESPSTYGPGSATLGARVCNDGANDITDIFINIGNYDPNGDSNPADSTAGIYPSRTHAPLVGSFSLTHEGGSAGTADATRYLRRIPAGECVVQYWIVSYPQLDSTGNSVTGGIKPDDDLWLNFDLWATGVDAAVTRNVDVTSKVNMRNEISASANKIWPNGDNKVPAKYVQAIGETLGWDTFVPGGKSEAYPGESVRTQGIWYDFGVVGAGFDNDGNFVPDHNAWMQPVGDASTFDPGCFRLVRTYGIVIVKVQGGEILIPFENELYFENIPDNTGTVGLVFYEYVALDGACSAALTPYQEVASGYDNEKFSGDFGIGMPPVKSTYPAMTMGKTVNQSVIGPVLPVNLTYAITFTNPTTATLGNPDYGVPLVINDAIPAGTTYIAGSATSSNVLPSGVSAYSVLYSHNGGTTWRTTEAPASGVTNIQWWLSDALQPGAGGTVRFQVTVPLGYPSSVVDNTAHLSFGSGGNFLEDSATTLVRGLNSLSGTVFRDDGAGGGAHGNGAKESGEAGLQNVTVSLYVDFNNDGVGDMLYGTTTSGVGGAYSFTQLPDGYFIVVVNDSDTDIPTGYTNTTPVQRRVSLDPLHASTTAVTATGIDFGFAPALTLDKRLEGSSPIYEGDTVQYTIDVTNKLPGNGTAAPSRCTYTAWATAEDSRTSGLPASQHFLNTANAFGAAGPNRTYSNSPYINARDQVAGTGFTMPNSTAVITKVEAIFSIYLNGALTNDDAELFLFFNNTQIAARSGVTNVPHTTLNTFASSQSAQGLLAWDVTSARTWAWADFAGNLDVQFDAVKDGSTDGPTIFIDAMGFRVTTSESCAATESTTLSPVPLSDLYDATRLQFVSSTPPADSSTPAGTLTWNDLGPIYPGQTKSVLVTFRALAVASPVTVNNVARVNSATFANDRPANTAIVTATATLNPTGSVAGVVWSEGSGGTSGWIGGAGGTGYQSGIDRFVPNVTVTLYACRNATTGVNIYPGDPGRTCTAAQNGGSWVAIATTTTDINGAYFFTALRDGFYYTEVTQSTLPGTTTQTGDTNQRTGLCSTCDNRSDVPSGGSEPNLSAVHVKIANANDVTNINYGYSVPPALYGVVWEDNDADQVREAGENGISGVTVTLYASDCTTAIVLTGNPTTTNANGQYQFANLTAGTTYCIKNSLGGTWVQTAESDGTRNNQISYTPVAGEVSGSHDFGYRRSGNTVIGDTLYYDWDGDGTQDVGEEGIRDVTVSLYEDVNGNGVIDIATDAFISSTTTLANGTYLFPGRPNGTFNYLVVVDENDPQFPTYVYPTADPDETGVCTVCDSKSLVATTTLVTSYLSEDFGYRPTGAGAIGDTVWYDRNGNGVQFGVQETGIPNITVSLLADFNNDGTFVQIMTTSTDADGKYLFANLPNGSYRVVVDTADPQLPKDPFGNPVAATTSTTLNVTVSNGATVLTADFGFANLGALGDTIYWDANADGEQDWNETGINGVTVSLYRDVNNNNVYDAGTDTFVASDVTASDSNGFSGKYLFSGLASGEYVVVVGPIPGSPTLTADPNADGVPCPGAGTGVLCDGQLGVTVTPGSAFMGVDFGYLPPGVIGDTLWIDTDADGMRDSTELGIPNITVTLDILDGVCTPGVNCPVLTTVTDADGYYSFQNLANGSYQVRVNTADPDFPAGLTQTFEKNDATPDSATSVVISGGAISSINGTACTSCSLQVDFGYRYAGTNDISGTVCLDGASLNGICDADTSGVAVDEAAYISTTVYLLRFNDTNGNNQVDPGETTTSMGSTLTDANGDYSFPDVPDGKYIIALAAPREELQLTTTSGQTPASTVVRTPSSGETDSAYQIVTVAASVTNLDFAFKSLVNYDFGDLPLSYSTTLTSSPDGPRHSVSGTPALYLGSVVPDSEANGVPSALADGDSTGTNDEDGVVFITPWREIQDGGSVRVTVTGTGWLVGWVDLNRDGDFADSGEMVINQAVSSGTNTYTFDVPVGTFSTSPTNVTIYSRFRLFEAQPIIPVLSYSGPTTNGEVEDYQLRLSPTAVTLVSFKALSSEALALPSWLPPLVALPLVALLGLRLWWRRRSV